MNRTYLFYTAFILVLILSSCQKSNKNLPSAVFFNEPEAPQEVSPVQQWDSQEKEVTVSWGSSNQRYHREYIPEIEHSEGLHLSAWKNERLNAQIVIYTKIDVNNVYVECGDLKSDNGKIASDAINYHFVRNVIADEFLGGCGYKTKSQETAHLVADCLENAEALNLSAKSTRGIWLTIDIPANVDAGTYSTTIKVKSGNKTLQKLNLSVEVVNRNLPNPADWKYELDLWQNPFAVARVHNVELWSEAHFDKMKPLFEILAGAGQKCITTTIVNEAWGGQALDPYGSMVKHTLKSNGEWDFDYTVFDNWVEFIMDLGIKKQINCYSLIPWGNQLSYFDLELGKDTFIVARAVSKEFAKYWTPFLIDFSQHLNEKGWFDITTIAMDERPLGDMQAAIKLITEHSGLKITSAANYAPGTSEHVYDLSVESRHILPDEILEKRKANGKKTTYYVCCSAEYPNNFTYSPPAEGVWQGWYAFAKKQDGFLRWAYNSWVEDPIHDTRFRTWPAGDTFFIYPGLKSSIRWEKLREGIQDYEKLRILVAELKDSSAPKAKNQLQKIEDILKEFEVEDIGKEGALKAVEKGKKLLKELS